MSRTATTDETKKLPDGWHQVRLGEVCKLFNGDSYRDSDWTPEGMRIVRIQNLNDPSKPFNHWAGPLDNRICVKTGDVLLAWSGTPGSSFGVHSWIRGDAVLNQHIFRVDLDLDKIAPQWAVFAINQQLDAMIGKAHGGVGLRHVTKGQVESLSLLLPPLSEQQRIAGVLNEQMAAVEKARMAAQARLEAVKALPAAFLRQVFPQPGQPLPDGWRWVRLWEVTSVVNGTTPDSENPCFWNGEIVWITPTDLGKLAEPYIRNSDRRITKAGFDSRNLTRVPPRSIVLSSRAPIGHLGIAAVELCTNQGCKSFIPNEDVDECFLYYSLKRSVWKLQQLRSGATFAEISKTQLENFIIPIPPIEEQRFIAGVLEKQMVAAEKTCAAEKAELDAINALPAALLRRAFNGEL